MSLTDAIASLATGTYDVARKAAGSYDEHGRWVAGASATMHVLASVQPARSSGCRKAGKREQLFLFGPRPS